MPLPIFPLANLQIWLTPLWFLSLGVTTAVLLLLVVYGLLWMFSRRAIRSIHQAASDGVITPLAYVAGAFVLLSLLAAPTMPLQEAWDSLCRLPTADDYSLTHTVAANAEDEEMAVHFDADELQSYSITSDHDLRISTEPTRAYTNPDLLIKAKVPYEWDPKKKFARGFQDQVTLLYVTNPGDQPVEFTFAYTTDVKMQAVKHLPVVVVSTLSVVLVYFLIAGLFPGISTIAIGTAKEALSQPLFVVLTVIGAVALVAYIIIPYYTFGEDVKILTDSGMTSIKVLALAFALWTACTGIAGEIEGKTALTLLSKPVSRRQFVLGKFFGILWPMLVMFVVLGTLLLIVISYKVLYDARETANPTPNWQLCYETMVIAIPGLLLAFFEATTLTAIAVAISTRLPMLPNLIICGTIYVIGNLLPQIVLSSADKIPTVAFTGNLLAVFIPVLEHFNIAPAIAAGQPVPYHYLAFAALYCALYSTAAMLLALLLFEDRDLA